MVFSGLPEDNIYFVHILEEVKDCNDGTVNDSKAELDRLSSQDERQYNQKAHCKNCHFELFSFLLLAIEYVFEHASILGSQSGQGNCLVVLVRRFAKGFFAV